MTSHNTALKFAARMLMLVITVAVVVGCGDDRGLVKVSGTVTFDGGPMPGDGYLRFVPVKVAEGFSRRPGIAKFTTDGQFRVRSFDPGDGLFPGEYVVFPFCWEVEPAMAGPPAKSYLPEQYTDESTPPFTLTVEAGKGLIKFDVPVVSQ